MLGKLSCHVLSGAAIMRCTLKTCTGQHAPLCDNAKQCDSSTLVITPGEQQQGEGTQVAAGMHAAADKQGTVLASPDTAAIVRHTEVAVHIAVVGMAAGVGEGMPAVAAGGSPVGVEGHMSAEEVGDSREGDDVLGVEAVGQSLHGRGVVMNILLVTCAVEACAVEACAVEVAVDTVAS